MTWRVGLIGCGSIGAKYDESRMGEDEAFTHAGMYLRHPAFELTCATDSNAPRLAEFGKRWPVGRLYGNAEELIRAENPDVVSIATPDETHAELLRKVLRAGTPRLIFTEKPVADDAATAIAIAEECERRGIALIVDYVRRFDANHRAARRLLQEGGLGRLTAATGYYVRGIRHNGCQFVNLARFLLGDVAEVQTVGPVKAGGYEGDPSLNVRLLMQDGTEVMLMALDRFGYAYSSFELDLFGAKGRLRLSEGGRRTEFWQVRQDPLFTNFLSLVSQEPPWPSHGLGFSLSAAARDIADILDGGAIDPLIGAKEAAKDLRVIEAALLSVATGNQPIHLDTTP